VPSKAQIILFWGPELVAIYNDAYRPVLGAKHPGALGVPARRLFSEAWHVLEPLFMGVVNKDERVSHPTLPPVTDIGMPDMDGARAALVALTGRGQDEDRRRVRAAGFDHHLVKPADFSALQSLIASIQSDMEPPAAS
jgi:hypothetical protein